MNVNDDYKEWNVEGQFGDPESVLAYWRQKKRMFLRMANSRCFRLRGVVKISLHIR